MVVLAATLPSLTNRVRHSIDYAGAGLLAVMLSSITLVSDLGGSAYPWSSPLLIGLIAVSVVSLALFAIVEAQGSRAGSPLRLFSGRRSWSHLSSVSLSDSRFSDRSPISHCICRL
jgi:hypothetical protein